MRVENIGAKSTVLKIPVTHFTQKTTSYSYQRAFGSSDMDALERLIENAKQADATLFPRLKAAARKLPKVVQGLTRKKRPRRR
jgi:hypothetical protein